ncbi:MAG: matrixin family metalloprotease [Hadesarchaea archaeon]|nr:MAG: matrixin family metalloprotease [Hadesarchaea archaeon]
MRSYLKLTLFVVTLTLALILIPQVFAYHLLGGRWPDQKVSYLKNYVYSPSPVEAEYIYAMQSWNDASTPAYFVRVMYWQGLYVNSVAVYEPEVAWLGMTSIVPSPYEYPYEYADVKLNLYYVSDFSSEKTQALAAHEYGHVLGLAHELSSPRVLMYPYLNVFYGIYGVYTPQQDDINGVNDLYS